MNYTYKPIGTCSKKMSFDIENGKIRNLKFEKGCVGNLTAIGRLVEGKDINEVIKMFKGIKCPSRKTSCPDQLAQALMSLKKKHFK